LLVAQNVARSGQRKVNQWVIEAIDPLQAGNARTIVKLESLKDILFELAQERDSSGRKEKSLLKQVRYLENQRRNFASQYEANITRARTHLLQAEQALESWVHYYEQMASIYTRARAAKLKVDVSSVQAEVPELESIELVEIPSLEPKITETKLKASA
jgi:outer membrane translocation and assembly module TamA